MHVIGKDIILFHAVYWPAILLSAGLQLPKKLLVHEFFTVNGQKMSKTLGNVIDPLMLIEKYGSEALRYYFLAKFSPFLEGDFSEERFVETYNSDLANGLGNLIARVAKLCENSDYTEMGNKQRVSLHLMDAKPYIEALENFKFNEALFFVWAKITKLDQYINEEKPWALAKTQNPRLKSVLAHAIDQIQEIAALLEPFLPETSKKIRLFTPALER